jgi:hypothetical protein
MHEAPGVGHLLWSYINLDWVSCGPTLLYSYFQRFHLPSIQIMPGSVKEELEAGHVLSVNCQEEPLSKVGNVENSPIWRKLDIHLLPLVTLLYLLSFL